MTPNLLESMQQQLTPDMIQHVSSFLRRLSHTQTAVDEFQLYRWPAALVVTYLIQP
jgi:hypothetical protein